VVAVRVVIVEDDALLREGIAALLRAEGIEVVATAATPDEFLAVVDDTAPDIAIVDVRMPPTHTDEGIDAAKAARARHPALAILVLSAYVEPAFATALLAGGVAGIGYLLKERVGRVTDFLNALRRVAAGGTAIDPDLVARLFARHHVHDEIRRLTAREYEVLSLMAQGHGNAHIAARLVVTERAVHKHIRNIFAKLGLRPADSSDRRVMAVLRYVEHAGRPLH
jgi:DNA-binding NarL/FixJ family response regulator